MLHPTRLGVLSSVLLVIVLAGPSASAQTEGAKLERSNLEVQLHLILATSETPDRNMSPALEPLIKQLKSTLPVSNYRLAATLTNRVRSGSTLEVRGVLPSEAISPLTNNSVIYSFTFSQVRIAVDDSQSVEVPKLRFNLRMPIITGMTRGDANTPATPAFNFEDFGLTTEVSLKEGNPTLVGTITTSKPGQWLVLMVSIKRTT